MKKALKITGVLFAVLVLCLSWPAWFLYKEIRNARSEDPLVWDVLPWGRDTTIKAKIENLTLRQALTAIMRKLGLQLVLRDQYVEIQPMPGLVRLGQRASIDELKAVDLLASRQLLRMRLRSRRARLTARRAPAGAAGPQPGARAAHRAE